MDQTIQIRHWKNPLADALKLCVLNAEFFAVEGLNQKRKIELLEVKFWKWKKQCLLSRGGRARVPKGPFQLAAPRASASGRTAASQVEC